MECQCARVGERVRVRGEPRARGGSECDVLWLVTLAGLVRGAGGGLLGYGAVKGCAAAAASKLWHQPTLWGFFPTCRWDGSPGKVIRQSTRRAMLPFGGACLNHDSHTAAGSCLLTDTARLVCC